FNISLGRSVCRGLTKVNISENPLLSEAWPDYWSLQPVAQAGLPSPSIDSSFAGHPGLPDPAARGAAGGGADVAPRRRPRPPAARQCASGFIKRRISGHARPCKSVELWLGSTDTVLIRRQGGQPAIRPGGGIRGVITGYSSASARRLLLTVRNMPNHNIFVTFTYPRAYPANGRICKEHLHRVKAYMKRQGADSGCWFLEFQERGAPHFHCYIKDRIEILGLVKAWNRIIGTADGDGFGYMNSVDIRKFRRPDRKAAYATKKAGYATKSAQKVVPDGFENVGRFWGVWGKPVA